MHFYNIFFLVVLALSDKKIIEDINRNQFVKKYHKRTLILFLLTTFVLAILKEKGITEPSKQDINKTLNKLEEEHHTIIFVYKTDRQSYGKYLQQVENDLLQRKDPFVKTVADASRILAGWIGKFSNKDYYKTSDANNSIDFATTSEEENKSHK